MCVASQETDPFGISVRSSEDVMCAVRQAVVRGCIFFLLGMPFCSFALANSEGKLRGRVLDPLGAAVPNAAVSLLRGGKALSATNTNQEGLFELSVPDAGRYSVHVEASGFEKQDSAPVFVRSAGTVNVDILLQIGSISQKIVVSATGLQVPDAQVGASVSVIDHTQLANLNKLDVSEALQSVPGLQVLQGGRRGGTTSVSILGGSMTSNTFNKVLVDGVPMNDIGGAFEFANLSTTGVERVEVFRGGNSVLYGTDALAGVVNITTPHGTTTPEVTYTGDGGNFGTYQNDVSLSGAFHQFDYFSEFARFDTQNGLPNDAFHNGTYAGNFGWAVNGSMDLRFTLRHTTTDLGDPNALNLYGVADTSSQKEQDTYWGLTLQNQTTRHWRNLVRLASTELDFGFVTPSPSGTPFNGNFLGNPVTIQGANGYSVAGQAILDFGGAYPQIFSSNTARRSVYAQSDYEFHSNLAVIFGFRYENENGVSNSQGAISPANRNNFSTFAEAHGNLSHRLYGTAGVGLDENAVFGFAASPRASLAYYLRQPTAGAFLGDTKLSFNFGKGIEEPSIFNAGSSLYSVLSQLPEGPALISRFGITPIGPERSTTFDYGVSQAFWNRRARLDLTFFHNHFYDLSEFLPSSALPLLGFPQDIVSAVANSGPGGAMVNSSSYRALGAEVPLEIDPGHGWRLGGAYTYIDAVVTQSFSSTPFFNPAFPGIPIGLASPLVGNRPFGIAPHSGSLYVDYERRRFGAELNGYFVARQDDSTFLTDAFFGTSMLLPNHNLNGGYQKIDLSVRYTLNPALTLFSNIENLLNERYTAAFGFPSLPLTFRTGIRLRLGLDTWRR
jgi:vitamin B12 transporter